MQIDEENCNEDFDRNLRLVLGVAGAAALGSMTASEARNRPLGRGRGGLRGGRRDRRCGGQCCCYNSGYYYGGYYAYEPPMRTGVCL